MESSPHRPLLFPDIMRICCAAECSLSATSYPDHAIVLADPFLPDHIQSLPAVRRTMEADGYQVGAGTLRRLH
jgi:hypothetical protein